MPRAPLGHSNVEVAENDLEFFTRRDLEKARRLVRELRLEVHAFLRRGVGCREQVTSAPQQEPVGST